MFKTAKSPDTFNLSNIHKLVFPIDANITAIAKEYQNDPNIEWAEPNYLLHASATPNDPWFLSQWGLSKINVQKAWEVEKGKSNIVIAVIDSGVDYNHVDIEANVWLNIYDIPGNLKDDDNNGYIDDRYGYDFVDVFPIIVYPGEDGWYRDNDPMDFDGHGTFCAGVAAAVTNNGINISGVCWDCRIMVVRAGYKARDGNVYFADDDVAAAIKYAADNGANVISMSFAGKQSNLIEDACEYAWNKGSLLVASSGNENGREVLYPAAYDSVIAVGATNENDVRCSPSDWGVGNGSNYGPELELVAPGNNIISVLPGDRVGQGSGTSFATPFVSGVAALIFSKSLASDLIPIPTLTNQEVREELRNAVVDLGPSGWDEEYGYGRIDAYKAIEGIISIKVSLDKTTYSPSESAILTVTLKDEDLNPVEGATITYLVKNSDHVTVKSGSCSDKGNGNCEATFNAPETIGSYTVEVTATKSGYEDASASASFSVINPAEGHNLRLTTLELNRNKAEPGDSVQIKCQIDNKGEYTEDVNVDIVISGPDYSFSPSTISIESLKPSHTTGIETIYTWDIPSDAKTGYYTIKVRAWSPSGDEDFSDNEKSTSVYVSTGEPPTYNAYYYEYRILEWNDNADYRKYGWLYKGAYGPVTFHNSYTGHDYTIAIPGVEAGTGEDKDFWIFIQRDDGALIETPNLDNDHKQSLSQYFEDNKLMVIFDFILYPSKDAYIKIGYPTTSASLNPYYQSGTVNEEITYNVDFPYVDDWWNPEVHKCLSADQPKIYKDEIIDWFDVVP